MKKYVDEYETTLDGQDVTIKVAKPREKVNKLNRKRTTAICPECGSKLFINNIGAWECSGSMLKIWEKLFNKYEIANEERKLKILSTISDTARFEELQWRWAASTEKDGQEFNCGYTNRLYPPIASNKSRLPDPLFVKGIERKLGRKLTEEELIGEKELWYFKGQYTTKYRDSAKKVTIPVVTLPDDVLSRDGL